MKKLAISALVLVSGLAQADTLDDQLKTMINQTRSGVCPTVVHKFYNGASGPDKFISVKCSNGNAYMVMVGNSDARVIACNVFEKVAGNFCFKKF